MTYLLDMSALLAFGVREHIFHSRVSSWVHEIETRGTVRLATCSLTELGFLRIITQASSFSFTIEQGKALLRQLKNTKGLDFTFLADDLGVADLPTWVRSPKQVADGHLVVLAHRHQAQLATLDERIPGALVVPWGK